MGVFENRPVPESGENGTPPDKTMTKFIQTMIRCVCLSLLLMVGFAQMGIGRPSL